MLERWLDNPFGPVNKTPEERERIAKCDARLREVQEQLEREREKRAEAEGGTTNQSIDRASVYSPT